MGGTEDTVKVGRLGGVQPVLNRRDDEARTNSERCTFDKAVVERLDMSVLVYLISKCT